MKCKICNQKIQTENPEEMKVYELETFHFLCYLKNQTQLELNNTTSKGGKQTWKF